MVQIKTKIISRYYECNHEKTLCKVNIKDISSKLQNWSKNRPEDKVRVVDISNNLKQTKSVIGEIRLWKQGNSYYIYDGLHRYKAAELLSNNANINLDLYIIVYDTANELNIIEEFMEINKTVPIPSLYIDNSSNTSYIQPIIRQYQEAYPDFAKPSRSPQKPNFNRDCVVDIIHNIIKDKVDFTSHKLVEILDIINNCIKADVSNNIYYNKLPSAKVLEKCRKFDLYLFLYGIEYFKLKFDMESNK